LRAAEKLCLTYSHIGMYFPKHGACGNNL
jgi:hypothetical protein